MLLVLLIDGYKNLKTDKFTDEIKQFTVDCLSKIFTEEISEKEYEEFIRRMVYINFPGFSLPSGFAELMD